MSSRKHSFVCRGDFGLKRAGAEHCVKPFHFQPLVCLPWALTESQENLVPVDGALPFSGFQAGLWGAPAAALVPGSASSGVPRQQSAEQGRGRSLRAGCFKGSLAFERIQVQSPFSTEASRAD